MQTQAFPAAPPGSADQSQPSTLRPRRERPAPVRTPVRPARHQWYLACKAAGDFVLAALLAVPAAPVLLVAALLVKLTSRGPAFYSQTRMGLNGKPFTIFKLRTMRHNCESLTGPR